MDGVRETTGDDTRGTARDRRWKTCAQRVGQGMRRAEDRATRRLELRGTWAMGLA